MSSRINRARLNIVGAACLAAQVATPGTGTGQDPWVTVDRPKGYSAAIAGNIPAIVYTGGGAWTIRKSVDGGATWATDDPAPPRGTLYAMTVDAAGAAYAAGSTNTPGSTWLVRKAVDGTWVTVDQRTSNLLNIARGIAVSETSGSIFTVGQSGTQWIVRRSGDGGTTWSTADSFQALAGSTSWAHAVAGSQDGRVYVGGMGYAASNRKGGFSWIARSSADDGATWTTVDTFDTDPKYQATLFSLAADADGAMYAAGCVSDPSVNRGWWVVRRSLTGLPGSWMTVDFFRLLPSHSSVAKSVTVDADGAIFVAGYCSDGAVNHWVVRKSLDGGTTWMVSDLSTTTSMAHAIRATPSGLFAGGNGTEGGTASGLVRKLGD